ncbi:MAG: hypothetical protein ACRECT_00400 [Thermoplasmata archaeon]
MPLTLSVVFLWPLLAKPGYLFYGDEIWFFYGNPSNVLAPFLSAWYNGNTQTGPQLIGFQLLVSATQLAGNYAANHILPVLLSTLAGFSFYFSGRFFVKLTYGRFDWLPRIGVLVGSVFYLVNWQNPNLVYPSFTLSMSYIVIPPLFVLMIVAYRSGRPLYCALFGAISAIGGADPTWILFIPLFALTYLIGRLSLSSQKGRDALVLLKVTALLIGCSVLFNAYFLIPALYGFVFHTGGVFSTYASGQGQLAIAQAVSWYRPIDAFFFGQPTYTFFGVQQQNYTWLAVFLPISAAFALLLRPRRFTVYLLVNLAIALVLVTGFTTSFGSVYAYLVLLSPPGIVGDVRDVGQWFGMAAFCYACLLTLLSYQLAGMTLGYWRARRSGVAPTPLTLVLPVIRPRRALRIRHVAVVIALTGFVLTAGMVATVQTTHSTLQTFTYPRYDPTYPPADYSQTMTYLDEHANSTKVMWLPSGELIDYPWKNGYPLSYEGLMFYSESVTADAILPYLAQGVSANLGSLLSAAGVSYLVYDTAAAVPYNGNSYGASYVESFLDRQSGLSVAAVFGNLTIYAATPPPTGTTIGLPVYGPPWISAFSGLATGSDNTVIYTNTTNTAVQLAQYSLLNYSFGNSALAGQAFSVSVPQGQQGLVLLNPNAPTRYDYSPSLYHLDSLVQTGLSGLVSMGYTIPSYLSNYTYLHDGGFGLRFGMLIQAFPTGENPASSATQVAPGNRVALVDVTNQIQSNRSGGIVSFTVPLIPDSDYYFSFYGPNYTAISPLYYSFSFGAAYSDGVVVQPLDRVDAGMQYEFLPPGQHQVSPTYYGSPPTLSSGVLNYSAWMNVPSAVYVSGNFVSQRAASVLNSSNVYVQLQQTPNFATSFKFAGGARYGLSSTIAGTALVSGETPIPGNYTLSIQVSHGTVTYDGVNTSGSSVSVIPIDGIFSADFACTPDTVANLSLVLARFNFTGGVSLTMASDTDYTGTYSASQPGLIVFGQQFSEGWLLKIGSESFPPISAVSSSATAFEVPSGSHAFSIVFVPETAQLIGFTVSGIAYGVLFGVMVAPVVYRRFARRRSSDAPTPAISSSE